MGLLEGTAMRAELGRGSGRKQRREAWRMRIPSENRGIGGTGEELEVVGAGEKSRKAAGLSRDFSERLRERSREVVSLQCVDVELFVWTLWRVFWGCFEQILKKLLRDWRSRA